MDATWLDRYLLERKTHNPLHSGRDGVRMVETSQGSIRIRAVGDRPRAIVFVCDSPVLIEHYDHLIEILRGDFRVLCIELPGLGFSRPRAGFDFSILSQTAAVREVIEAQTLRDCVLAFGCVGAYIGVLLAERLSRVVRGVVLMQATGWEDECRWAKRIDFRGRGVIATPYLGQLVVHLGRGPIAKRWLSKSVGRPELANEFVKHTDAAFDAGCGWALASLTQAYFGHPPPVLPPVQQKGVLVWGNRDRSHQDSDPHSGLAYLTNGELVVFEEAGHFPELEEPERFARILHSF